MLANAFGLPQFAFHVVDIFEIRPETLLLANDVQCAFFVVFNSKYARRKQKKSTLWVPHAKINGNSRCPNDWTQWRYYNEPHVNVVNLRWTKEALYLHAVQEFAHLFIGFDVTEQD